MRWPLQTKFKLFQGQRGFTLIEVLVAMGIIVATGTALLIVTDTNARARRVLDEKVQATNLVTSFLEGIRQLPYSDSDSPYASVNASIVKPPQYVVAMDIAYSPNGDDWAPTSNGGAYKLQRITISVSREGGKPVLSTCTFRVARTE